MTAARTELLVLLLGGEEASMTTHNGGAKFADALHVRREKIEIHLQEDVLHGEVDGHGCHSYLGVEGGE